MKCDHIKKTYMWIFHLKVLKRNVFIVNNYSMNFYTCLFYILGKHMSFDMHEVLICKKCWQQKCSADIENITTWLEVEMKKLNWKARRFMKFCISCISFWHWHFFVKKMWEYPSRALWVYCGLPQKFTNINIKYISEVI